MTVFCSKASEYTHMITEAESQVVYSRNGAASMLVTERGFTAEFKPLKLSKSQRDEAVALFSAINPSAPFGAVPYPHEGIVEGVEGGAYDAYDPAFQVGRFDTDTDIPFRSLGLSDAESQQAFVELVEDRLRSSPDYGRDMVELAAVHVELPWPKYEEASAGPGGAKKVREMVEQLGLSPRVVIDYERQRDPTRPSIVKDMEALEALQVEVREAELARTAEAQQAEQSSRVHTGLVGT